MPKAKAKNAYELLERVCRAIAEAPQHYNQTEWCGTAYCRAGWIVAVHDGPIDDRHADDVGNRAMELLDLSSDECWPLFSTYELFRTDAEPGTSEYAEEGVRGVRVFMSQYSSHLKARSLKGV